MLTCALVPRRGTPHSPLFQGKLTQFFRFKILEQDFGSIIDVSYLDTANTGFEFRIQVRFRVQNEVGAVQQNGVRVVGSLFSNRLDKYEFRVVCWVRIFLSAQTMLNILSGIMRMSESAGVLRYSWVERPSTAPPFDRLPETVTPLAGFLGPVPKQG